VASAAVEQRTPVGGLGGGGVERAGGGSGQGSLDNCTVEDLDLVGFEFLGQRHLQPAPAVGGECAGSARPADGQVSGGRSFSLRDPLQTGTGGPIGPPVRVQMSGMTRVLRLTLLAPDIVEAILDGRQGPELTLGRLLEGFPVEWHLQRLDMIVREG
tara:strand:- start:3011 stop:3481 length:471 start_codon:yes stop_codon:yes gene_type:complete